MTAAMLPATFGQASLYFAEAWSPRDGAYNTSIAVHVRGPVPGDRLASACRNLYRATAALRLRMGIAPGTGDVGWWLDDGEPDIERHDRAGAGEAAAAALIDAAARRPFDADEGAMARFLVVRTGADSATLGLVFHHLVSDGSSHRELAERLTRCVTEDLAADDGGDYADLVYRVRDSELRARRADRDYWHERITPEPGTVRLTRHVGPGPKPPGGRRMLALRRAGTGALDAAAAAAGSSRFRVLIALVHHALPGAAAGRSLVCTAAGHRPAGPPVVGCFINQVPLMATRREGDTVPALAVREDAAWRDDLRRRYFPFADLVAHAGQDAGSRLDSVMIGYRVTPRVLRRRAADVTCSADLTNRYGAPKTELCVRFFDHGGEMSCEVEWDGGLRAGEGERFADVLACLMPWREMEMNVPGEEFR